MRDMKDMTADGTPPLSSADRGESFRLVPERTTVQFTTRHLFGLGAVRGSVDMTRGRVVVDRAKSRLVLLEAELDMTSFESASDARDKVVGSPKFLDTAAHPTASYRSESAHFRDHQWTVAGELTVKNITVPVALTLHDFDVATADMGGSFRATGRIDRFAFDITFPTMLAARHLDIEIRVQGQPADGA
jgi:polyisoprenoid-binding protein YceI